jgi:hypothetical protein
MFWPSLKDMWCDANLSLGFWDGMVESSLNNTHNIEEEVGTFSRILLKQL